MINLILLGVAITLLVIMAPISVIFTLLNPFAWNKGYALKLAKLIDKAGNVLFAEFFNLILIKGNAKLFGDDTQTISAVIGYNYVKDTLSPLGSLIRRILDSIEPNHCLNAMLNDSSRDK